MAEPLEFEVRLQSLRARTGIDALQKKFEDLKRRADQALEPALRKSERAMNDMGRAASRASDNVGKVSKSANSSAAGIVSFIEKIEKLARAFLGFVVVREILNIFRSFTRVVGQAVNEMVKWGDEIATVSQKTGIAVDQLQILEFVARRSDVSFRELTTAVRFSQRAFDEAAQGVAEYAEPIERLGVEYIDPTTGKVREFVDMLPELAEAFKNIESPTERASIAMQIFGRAGTAMLPLFDQGEQGILALTRRFEELGGAMSDRAVNAATAADDALKDLKTTTNALVREGVTPLVEEITKLENSLTRLLVAVHGVKGTKLGDDFQRIATGTSKALEALVPFYRYVLQLKLQLQVINELLGIGATKLEDIAENAKLAAERFQEAAGSMAGFGVPLDQPRGTQLGEFSPRITGGPGPPFREGPFGPEFTKDQMQFFDELVRIEEESREKWRQTWEKAFGQLPPQMQPKDIFEEGRDAKKAREDAQKAREKEINTMRLTAETARALSSVFDGLNSKLAQTITAVLDFILRLSELISSLRGTTAGQAAASAVGAAAGAGSSVDLMNRVAIATESSEKHLDNMARTITSGTGVAPYEQGGQPFLGAASALSAITRGVGIGGAFLGFAGAIGRSLADRANKEDRERLQREREAWARALQVGGPELTGAMRRGGYVRWAGTTAGGPRIGTGTPWWDNAYGGSAGSGNLDAPYDAGKGGGEGAPVTINVNALDSKSVGDFFRGPDFKSSIAFLRRTRERPV